MVYWPKFNYFSLYLLPFFFLSPLQWHESVEDSIFITQQWHVYSEISCIHYETLFYNDLNKKNCIIISMKIVPIKIFKGIVSVWTNWRDLTAPTVEALIFILPSHVIRVSAQHSLSGEGLSITTLTTILCGYLASSLWVYLPYIFTCRCPKIVHQHRCHLYQGTSVTMKPYSARSYRRAGGHCRQNIMRYQCTPTAIHPRFNVMYFLRLSFLLAVLPTDPSLLPACHSMCEAHMEKWNCCLREHASACPDFIRRIKEWDEKKIKIKMMIARLWFFSFFPETSPLFDPHAPPCQVCSK